MDGWQVLSLFGSLQILFAYVASQMKRLEPGGVTYNALNFGGSAVLTVVAIVERQWGFLLLESVWALVSLWALARPLIRRT